MRHKPFTTNCSLFCAAALLLAGCVADSRLTLTPAGEYPLPQSAPEGLSGIACVNGDTYALAEDSGGRIHTAQIGVDKVSRAITNCVFTGVQSVPGLVDAEGIADETRSGSLIVSDETGPKILQIHNGEPLPLRIPDWLQKCRPNKSLEALSYEMLPLHQGRLWTANEDAIADDGPASSATNAALVRITAFMPFAKRGDSPIVEQGRFGDWWYYRLDAAQGGPIPGAGPDVPFNGLVGLAALGRGRLLVLERSCGFVPGEDGAPPSLITSSIYYVDTSRTKPGSPTPLRKKLLWQQRFPFSNYEGVALGPRLADGSRAVILVADGDTSTARVGGMTVAFQWKKALFALKLLDHAP